MNGSDRMTHAKEHEVAVMEKVRGAGWICEPFGQAMLSKGLRDALKLHHTPIRWMPDLIAVRDDVLLIDAKWELRTDTPNFSIEREAWEASRRWSSTLAVAVIYVFADFTANNVDFIVPIWSAPERRGWYGGSGTAFILVRKADQHPFDEFFGP